MRLRLTEFVLVATCLWCSSARGELAPFGGAHAAYAFGGSVAQSGSGFRHGLDLAVMPFFFVNKSEKNKDYAFGASGLVGFGATPSYLALDFGLGDASGIFPMGNYRGLGPVVRFPKGDEPPGFGGEVRLAFDILCVEVGLRSMLLWGRDASEWLTLFSAGLGRF
jgi:hypothetical protein